MKLSKATFRHIEKELYCYHDTKEYIKELREQIMDEVPKDVVGIKPTGYRSSITEIKGTKLADHKLLREMERITKVIEEVYTRLPDERKRMIELKYWSNLSTKQVAEKLHVDDSTIRRWRQAVVYAIALRLGWR